MRRLTMILAMFLALTVIPALALAHCGSCGHDTKGGDKVAANHQEHEGHGGMAATGSMLELGTATASGVAAHAEMKDVREAMSKMGMKTTHHFMIMFTDEKTGKSVESGKVAVKITTPDGTIGEPLELMGMQGHFGADVTLDKPGKYTFQVGTKLVDGEARQFSFTTTLK